METSKKFIVSNVLCFLVNIWHYLASKPLKALLVDFYTSDELTTAKDILVAELDTMKLDKQPKLVRNRKVSTGKNTLEIDDILSTLQFLDEAKLLGNL
jgi:hypothetical protein